MIRDGVGVGLGIGGISPGERIGSGASADVYRAEQPALGRVVAVKVITAAAIDPELVRRFSQENRALGALSSHPNIVTVYDVGVSTRGRPYVVMQFVAGGSLAGVRLRPDHVLEVGIAIAGALAEAHEHPRRILHRDIKPANILMDEYGTPLLADFGLAVFGDGRREETVRSIGTPAFMAPELFYNAEPTVTTDVYGLAATLYALTMGYPPFSHDEPSVPTLIRRATMEPLDPVPAGPLGDFIQRSMDLDPRARPQSMIECAEELQAIQRRSRATVTPLRLSSADGEVQPSIDAGAGMGVSAKDRKGVAQSGRRGLVGGLVSAAVLVGLLAGFVVSASWSSLTSVSAPTSPTTVAAIGVESVGAGSASTTTSSLVRGMLATDEEPGAVGGVGEGAEVVGVRLSPTSIPSAVESPGCVSVPLHPSFVPTGAMTTLVDDCPHWQSTLAVSREVHEYSLDLSPGQMVTVVTDSIFTAIMTPSDVPIYASGPEGGDHTFVAAEAGLYQVRLGGPAAIDPAGPQRIAFFTTK